MAERLCGGNIAIALLATAVATGATLVALISALNPISGAPFNPIMTLADAFEGGLPWRDTAVCVVCQVAGAMAVAQLLGGPCAALLFKWTVPVEGVELMDSNPSAKQ